MDNLLSSTFFWIQKKNEKNENMVVIDGTLSSFDKIPHSLRFFNPSGRILVKETSKTNISIVCIYPNDKSKFKDYSVVCLICISGWIDEKDSSKRNIAYTFFYETPKNIDANILVDIENNLKKCLKLTDSLDSFDEKDFKECLSLVDSQECNKEMNHILMRNYKGKSGLKKALKDVLSHPEMVLKSALFLGATVVPAVVSLRFKRKNKPTETVNPEVKNDQ